MEIKRIGSQPSGKGPDEWFTGTVRVTVSFNRTTRHAQLAPALRLSPVPAPHGTLIPSARPLS